MGEIQSVDIENSNEFQTSLSPNPADEYTLITFPYPINLINGSAEIYTSLGKKALSIRLDNNNVVSIPTANLPSGIYSYSIKAENGLIKSNGTFVVQR